MSLSLYDLTTAQRAILEGACIIDPDTGEYFDATNLDDLQGAIQDKLDTCACYIKELTAEAEAIKEEEKRLKRRREVIEHRLSWFKTYVLNNMQTADIKKVETARNRITYRKSTVVDIYDETALWHTKYMRQKIENMPDKKLIGDALKAGETVPGAMLVERSNLVVG